MSKINLRRILVVDDEPHILSAVQRELHAPPADLYEYAVEGFTDPVLALQRAREISFDAVISDYRMPGMNGVQFLRALAAVRPDCARIVLSGQTDAGALTHMINESHVYRFIPKPWNAYYLKASLGQALDYSAVLQEHRHLASIARARGMQPTGSGAGNEANIDRVLIVDDDAAVLNSLLRLFHALVDTDVLLRTIDAEAGHPVELGWHIDFQVANSPLRALELAGQAGADFSCVIADQQMPEMAGVDLLKRFAILQPDCARILLSGGIGQDDLIHAVNSVHIFAFIEKPWADFEMKKTLLLALSRRRMLRENRSLARLVAAPARPPTPTFDEDDPRSG